VIFYDPELILSRLRLFRAPSLRILAHRLSARASPAWVLGPPRDITRAQPPNRNGSHAVTSFRPQAFTAFRRLPPRPGLQAYFIPQPRPGSFPFRGFSPRAATLPLREELPPGRCFRCVLTDLRRLPPASDLGSEAFIRTRPRSIQHSYSPRCTPLPSSGSSPPGPHFTRSIASYLRPPLSTFFSLRLRFRDRASSSSPASLPREAWRRVSASPTCSSFRAFLQISVLVTPTHRPLPCDEPVRDSPPSARLPSQRALFPEHAPIQLPRPSRASPPTSSHVLDTCTVISSSRLCHPNSVTQRMVTSSRQVCRSVSRSTLPSHDSLTARLATRLSLRRDFPTS